MDKRKKKLRISCWNLPKNGCDHFMIYESIRTGIYRLPMISNGIHVTIKEIYRNISCNNIKKCKPICTLGWKYKLFKNYFIADISKNVQSLTGCGILKQCHPHTYFRQANRRCLIMNKIPAKHRRHYSHQMCLAHLR